MEFITKVVSYLVFALVLVGIVILNITMPPWQYIGLALSAIGIFLPIIETLLKFIHKRFIQSRGYAGFLDNHGFGMEQLAKRSSRESEDPPRPTGERVLHPGSILQGEDMERVWSVKEPIDGDRTFAEPHNHRAVRFAIGEIRDTRW